MNESLNYSVVITHFNKIRELKELLLSLDEQTVTPNEVIIVDDCSDVNLNDLESEFDFLFTVKIFINSSGKGANYCRNFGISKSKNNIVALCDDDDLWYPNKAEEQLGIINSGFSLSLCNYVRFDSEGCYAREKSPRSGVVLLSEMLKGNAYCGTTGVFLRKDQLTVRFDETLGSSQDWDFYLQSILAGHNVHYTSKALFLYRINQLHSITSRRLTVSEFARKFDATRKYRSQMHIDNFCQRVVRLWFNHISLVDNKFMATKFVVSLLGVVRFIRFTFIHVSRVIK